MTNRKRTKDKKRSTKPRHKEQAILSSKKNHPWVALDNIHVLY
jgi:hypothetical protein